MKLTTTRFGEIEIQEDSILSFPFGIPGFPSLKRFVVIDYKDPIKWLHSVEDPDVAFIVTVPFVLFPEYSFTIKDDVEEFLGIKESSDVVIFAILSVSDNNLMANLKAPLVVNISNKKAVQILLEDDRYSFRVPLPSNSL